MAPLAIVLTTMCGWQSLLVRPAALTIDFVFKKLHAIAIEKGSGAAGRRQRFVVGLINRCRCVDHVVYTHGGDLVRPRYLGIIEPDAGRPAHCRRR